MKKITFVLALVLTGTYFSTHVCFAREATNIEYFGAAYSFQKAMGKYNTENLLKMMKDKVALESFKMMLPLNTNIICKDLRSKDVMEGKSNVELSKTRSHKWTSMPTLSFPKDGRKVTFSRSNGQVVYKISKIDQDGKEMIIAQDKLSLVGKDFTQLNGLSWLACQASLDFKIQEKASPVGASVNASNAVR